MNNSIKILSIILASVATYGCSTSSDAVDGIPELQADNQSQISNTNIKLNDSTKIQSNEQSQTVELSNAAASDYKSQPNSQSQILELSTDKVKTYRSAEMPCGTSTFQFVSTCYDEQEGLSDRGSSGGVRDYCEDVKLSIKNNIGSKSLSYPIMPDYQRRKYEENGYSFKGKIDNEMLTPETFSCAVTQDKEHYLFIGYHYSHSNEGSDILDKMNQNSTILNENGDYVSEDIANVLNEPDEVNIEFLESESTNVMYIGK